MKPNQWNKLMAPDNGEGSTNDGGISVLGGAGQQQQQSSIVASEGTKAWYSELPTEFQHNPFVAQSKDLAGFVKAAVDTKNMVGANTIRLPGENATESERAEFYTKLGRPAEPTAYTPTVQPVKEGLIDANVLDFMQKEIHKLGLSEAQGKGILDAYLGQVNSGFEAQQAQLTAERETGISTLKSEWGPKFEANVKTAQLAIRQNGDENLLKKIDESGLGNDVGFIKMMHKIGLQLLDDDASGVGGGQFTGSTMQATAEIDRLKADTDFQSALNNAVHPNHKQAVERWIALHRDAFPGKAE